MKRIIRLTENDLTRIVRRVIKEQTKPQSPLMITSLTGKRQSLEFESFKYNDNKIEYLFICDNGQVNEGFQKQGDIYTAKFELKNTSNEDITVNDVDTSTFAFDFPGFTTKTLRPQQSMALTIECEPKQIKDRKEGSVDIYITNKQGIKNKITLVIDTALFT